MSFHALNTAVLCLLLSLRSGWGLKSGSLWIDGIRREYRVYQPLVPAGADSLPLALFLHGGGGNARQFARHSRFCDLAETEGFLAVFPEGLRGHWNDGRRSEPFLEQDSLIDDVKFVRVLLDTLRTSYPVDGKRIYAAGMSNGGFMCQRLAMEMSGTFAAVASVTAQLSRIPPPGPRISVLLMNGTEDPLVPYEGGEIRIGLLARRREGLPSRGEILSTEETIRLWMEHNGIQGPPEISRIPDADPTDGCIAEVSKWLNPESGTEVVLVKTIGGGHTFPGKSQYLPSRIIGRTCKDFDGALLIWEFFERHRLLNEKK